MNSMNIEVLCVSDYFLPGFRGGGPIRTLDNMRKEIAGQITLSIFTRDRDLGSDRKYPGIETNQWIETKDGPVYYASPDYFGPRGLRLALAARDFDIVYLNSYFSPRASVLIYFAIRKHAPMRRILIAPRGEFSPGALAIKRYKKNIFLSLARLFGFYRDVFWHASTQMEAKDILSLFPNAVDRIYVAPDPVLVASTGGAPLCVTKNVECLRIAFISRISPMKNLDGLISTLKTVGVPVELDIFGPIEDDAYWRLCDEMIATLPDNIKVKLYGPISPEAVSSTFANYDLFAFPTRGENFGHVIFEALRAGIPVLISDKTPWHPDECGAVTVIPLEDADGWRNAILNAFNRTCDEQKRLCIAAIAYANQYIIESGSLRKNIEMFRMVMRS